jgi:hypothetical protein
MNNPSDLINYRTPSCVDRIRQITGADLDIRVPQTGVHGSLLNLSHEPGIFPYIQPDQFREAACCQVAR